MKKLDISKATRMFHNTGFLVRKHSPVLFVIAGTVGVVASAVIACKATTKLNDVLEQSKEAIDQVHTASEKPEILPEGTVYTDDDVKNDLRIIYVQTGIKLVKLYGPSVALGILSLSSILMSNRILSKRNVALAAAYSAVDKGFKDYRSRVVDRFGEQIDKELRYNLKVKEVEKITIDENGEEQKTTDLVEVAEVDKYSEYAKFFTDDNPYWTKDAEYNLMFLRQQQSYANDKLKRVGRVFLNEVYEALGIPKTKAGQVVGWVYDENSPLGDNYIDFGIYDANTIANSYFVNGYEKSILLDFNVDGNIWDLM